MKKSKNFKLWPTRKQWNQWTLPSKLGVIGCYLTFTSLFITILFFFIKNCISLPKEDLSLSMDDDSYVELTSIKLIDSKEGEYPYDDEILYSFILKGNYSKSIDDRSNSLICFYKVLSHPDQKYGWFAVEKLDWGGLAEPNSVPLDELKPELWEYHTSRIYLEKPLKPVISFIVFILPNRLLKKEQRKIVSEEGGWGKQNLNFLKEYSDVVYSDIIIFKNNIK